MELRDRVVVVTGAASGIGRELAVRARREGARCVVVADVQRDALESVAAEAGAVAVACDVSREDDVRALIDRAESELGPVEVFFSNAGILSEGGEETPDELWRRNLDVHLMAHVYAARRLAPAMAARGEGYIVITASAAGLLTHLDSATYAVSKHAAVAFAEWLAIEYGPRGVRVSVLCPQAVRTAMTEGREGTVASVDGMIETTDLADCVVETMSREAFLILPHPEVLEYMQRKSGDVDRWLHGMQRLKQRFREDG